MIRWTNPMPYQYKREPLNDDEVKSGEEEKTNSFLESLKIYVLDGKIANKAGEYIREYQKRE